MLCTWENKWNVTFSLFLTYYSVFVFLHIPCCCYIHTSHAPLLLHTVPCLFLSKFTHLENVCKWDVLSIWYCFAVRLLACCICMRCWSPSSIASLMRRNTSSWTRVRSTWTAQGKNLKHIFLPLTTPWTMILHILIWKSPACFHTSLSSATNWDWGL